MNITTPTTAEIKTSIVNQLQASLDQSIPFLPKSFLRVLAGALAGTSILQYKYAGFSALQKFVTYASTKEITINGRVLIPLVEWGRLLGVGDPLAATRAILDVEVPVTLQGGTLSAGAQLIFHDSGVVYTSTGPVQLNASTVTVRVRASSDQSGGDGIGTIGNRQVGDVLSFASPLPNVGRTATVSSVATTAENAESWDSYRRRILERASAKPQGGAYADYRVWAREVPGIVSVYPYTGLPGEVDVYIEASVESSDDPDGIPTSAQITAVEEAIERDVDGIASRRPANAAVNVLPISRLAFDVQISGLSGPANLQEDITDAIRNYYLEREPFIVGLSILPRKDRVLESTLIGIVDSIVNATGGSCGPVLQYLDGAEAPSHTLSGGEKAKLGSITFL